MNSSSAALVFVSAALASPGGPFASPEWPTAAILNTTAAPAWPAAREGGCGMFAGRLNGLQPFVLNRGKPLVRDLAHPRNCPGIFAVSAAQRVGLGWSAPYVYLSGDRDGTSDLGAHSQPASQAAAASLP